MSTDNVLDYVQSKAIGPVRKATGDEVHTACWFHGEDPGARGRLYINVDPNAQIQGLFSCKVCDARGSFVSLKKHFGDYEPNKREEDSEQRNLILGAATRYHVETLAKHSDVYDWLRDKRGLTAETIAAHQLGFDDGGLFKELRSQGFSLTDIQATGLVSEERGTGRPVDFLNNCVTIPYHLVNNVSQIRGRQWNWRNVNEDGPKYKTCFGTKSRLFNSDAVWHAKDVFIVEGEFDCLVLEQLGKKAVAVPGANTWQDQWDGYMSMAEHIYTVFDSDEAGRKGTERLKERFGGKVRNIELPEEQGDSPDITDWINKYGHTVEDLDTLVSDARGGGLLLTVWDALKEHQDVQSAKGIQFGNEKLDLILRPGLLPGQVMVVLAKSGSGKTIWLLNAMQRMAMVPGQEHLKFLFLSLEQTRGEWFERARRMHRFYNPAEGDKECLDFWADRFLMTDKNRMTPEQFNEVLDDYEYRFGQLPDVIGLDYLGYFARGFPGESYQRTTDAIMAVKEVAKERKVIVITPHQVSRIAKYGEEPDADAARDAGAIEETADFLFTLWTPDHTVGRDPGEKTGRLNMRIGKSRHGGRGQKLEYQFSPLTLTILPRDTSDARTKQLLTWASDELHYEQIGDDWETAIMRHSRLMSSGMRAMPTDRMIQP